MAELAGAGLGLDGGAGVLVAVPGAGAVGRSFGAKRTGLGGGLGDGVATTAVASPDESAANKESGRSQTKDLTRLKLRRAAKEESHAVRLVTTALSVPRPEAGEVPAP